jgi:hypothetical protein
VTRVSPSSDPEVQRERRRARDRARYARNAEEMAEKQRAWREKNPGRSREINNASRNRNVEKAREYNRTYRADNRDDLRARRRAAWATDPDKYRGYGLRAKHGKFIAEDLAVMREAQNGCCYLCGDPLPEGTVHIDHDHRCCDDDHTCRTCRRGIACPGCNVAIGMALDDPDRLRRIADNLEAAKRAFEQRMHTTPHQLDLLTGS